MHYGSRSAAGQGRCGRTVSVQQPWQLVERPDHRDTGCHGLGRLGGRGDSAAVEPHAPKPGAGGTDCVGVQAVSDVDGLRGSDLESNAGQLEY